MRFNKTKLGTYRHRSVEATLVTENLLKGPDVVAVPQQELVRLLAGASAVDVRGIALVKTDNILISVLEGLNLPDAGFLIRHWIALTKACLSEAE